MKYLILVWVSLVVQNFAFAGGFTVNNGGDTVECVASPISPFVGFYNLDYLVNIIYKNKYAADFEQAVTPNDQITNQIDKIINATAFRFPTFSRSLVAYRRQIFVNDFNAPYTWKSAQYGLVEVNDEKLRLIIPANCQRTSATGPFIQTIVRAQKPEQIEFTYFPAIFDCLSNIQKSFLLFHEWLWNLTDDPEIVRNANSILHSKDWSDKNLSYKMTELAMAGLDFSRIANKSYVLEVEVYEDRLMSTNWFGTNEQYQGIPQYRMSGCPLGNYCRFRFLNNTDKNIYGIQSSRTQKMSDFRISPRAKGSLLYESYAENMIQYYCIFVVIYRLKFYQ